MTWLDLGPRLNFYVSNLLDLNFVRCFSPFLSLSLLLPVPGSSLDQFLVLLSQCVRVLGCGRIVEVPGLEGLRHPALLEEPIGTVVDEGQANQQQDQQAAEADHDEPPLLEERPEYHGQGVSAAVRPHDEGGGDAAQVLVADLAHKGLDRTPGADGGISCKKLP